MFHSDIGVSGKQAEKRRTYGARSHGRMAARSHGRMAARSHGRMAARSHGRMVARSHGRSVQPPKTLFYREQNLDTADDEWYEDCISDELEEIAPLYEKPEYKNDSIHTLRIHPIITYVGDEWLRATEEGREPSIANVNLADVFPLITSIGGGFQLHGQALSQHPMRHHLPSLVLPLPVRDAPTVNEDVEMADDDGGVTPKKKKAGKRPAVQSPTPAPRVPYRRNKADSGDAIPVSSEDEVKAPIPRRKRKRRDSTLVDDSASELETGLTDPGACGPCKVSRHKCKPQVSTKGLTCRLCIKRKIKCDPPSAVSQAIINARKKKHSNEDIVKRLDITARSQEEFNTAVRDFMFNTDTVLRALCTHGQGKVNLASLGLHLPAVPRFSEAEPSTPGASSVTSGVSSLGLSRMMVDNAGVAGPSEPQPEYGDTEPSRPGLRRRTSRSGTSSKVPSRAGSRQSSRGRK
ncbi:hypothetical protein EDB84DRAFT_1445141 [Lactarius hengduanensis]|nr:hypothetical protein EDB84DRAFT_1445141 [Lactarius hengduanensis]